MKTQKKTLILLFSALIFSVLIVSLLHKISTELSSFRHRSTVSDVSFSPDGNTLASSGYDGQIIAWDVKTQIGKELAEGATFIFAVDYSPDGKTIASESHYENRIPGTIQINNGVVELRDAITGIVQSQFWKHASQQHALHYSPDGMLLAFGEEQLILWEVHANRPRFVIDAKVGGINSIEFSPDGMLVASGGNNGGVSLADVATGHAHNSSLVHSEGVLSMKFSPDGKIIATSSGKSSTSATEILALDKKDPAAAIPHDFPGIVKFWDVSTRQLKFQRSTTSMVHTIAFSPDGKTLAIGQEDGNVILLDVKTGSIRSTVNFGRAIKVLMYSPNQKTLVAGCGNRVLFIKQ